MHVFGDPNTVEEYGIAQNGETDVKGVIALGYDPARGTWLALQWASGGSVWLAGGGKEPTETYEQAAVRELHEETGYTQFADQVQLGGPVISHYYNEKKALYRRSYAYGYLFLLDAADVGAQALEPHEAFSVIWLDYDALVAAVKQTGGGVEHWLTMLVKAHDYVQQQL